MCSISFSTISLFPFYQRLRIYYFEYNFIYKQDLKDCLCLLMYSFLFYNTVNFQWLAKLLGKIVR